MLVGNILAILLACLRSVSIRLSTTLFGRESRETVGRSASSDECTPDGPRLSGRRRSVASQRQISRPLSDIQESYDVVVIGSGYGGSVAASRMARTSPKLRVCVLEKGVERWPGQYPSTFLAAIREIKLTGVFDLGPLKGIVLSFGKSTALYHWLAGKASSAVVGIGLGGTSLINANVFLRADSAVLRAAEWPKELRVPGALSSGKSRCTMKSTVYSLTETDFARAEVMLEPTPYPAKLRPLAKYDVLKRQAHAVALDHQVAPVPLTTSFQEGPNKVGVYMHDCSGNGQESVGQNDGSKLSTLTTYLADAWSWGADVFCEVEVRYVIKHPAGGYLVAWRPTSQRSSDKQVSYVHAKKLVCLGSGTVGTTSIMLRSREAGLKLSDNIGRGISGNGSSLSFGCGIDRHVGAVGSSLTNRARPGPTISGCLDLREAKEIDGGFLVQDGTFPLVLTTLFRLVQYTLPIQPLLTSSQHVGLPSRIHRFVQSFTRLDRNQIYLTVGHDAANGRITLVNDQPCLDMRGVEDREQVGRVQKLLMAMTHAFGGVYKTAGVKTTVHLLGGMNMAQDGSGKTGATSHTAEVFAGSGIDVNPGLVVVDGSVVPRSLGSNPLATITALAERSVRLATKRIHADAQIDYDTFRDFDLLQRERDHNRPGRISFSETMTGHVVISGRRAPISLEMHVQVQQIGRTGSGQVRGHVSCAALAGTPLPISSGEIAFFESDQSAPEQEIMVYSLNIRTDRGYQLKLHGAKTFNASVTLSPGKLWDAATTLRFSISRDGIPVLAEGLVTISGWSFIKQVASLRAEGATLIVRWTLMLQFISFFALNLSKHFFTPFRPLQYPPANSSKQRTQWTPRPRPDVITSIEATDGIITTLRVWQPFKQPENHPPRNILFLPGAAVTHEIFALPSIQKNAIEYFTEAGCRCFVLSHRLTTVSSPGEWTTYDVRLDIAAALREIKRLHGEEPHRKPYVVAHCLGAMSLASAILDSTVRANEIAGITASGVFLHPIVTPLNRVKARLPVTRLYRVLAGQLFSTTSSPADELVQRVINNLLRFLPQIARRNMCTSVTCHRCQLIFGGMWTHDKINEATHAGLHKIMGNVDLHTLQHLVAMDKHGTVIDNAGRSLLTAENLSKFASLPVLLFSGGENQVYSPEATLRSYRELRATDGVKARHVVFSGFGHLDPWMSNQSTIIYVEVLAEVDRVMSAIHM